MGTPRELDCFNSWMAIYKDLNSSESPGLYIEKRASAHENLPSYKRSFEFSESQLATTTFPISLGAYPPSFCRAECAGKELPLCYVSTYPFPLQVGQAWLGAHIGPLINFTLSHSPLTSHFPTIIFFPLQVGHFSFFAS